MSCTESLEQQTATSEVLQVISSSPGQLETVFQAMAENAVRVCGAAFGSIYRCEGAALQLVASHNPPPAYAETVRRLSGWGADPQSPLGRMIATKSTIHVTDLAAKETYVNRTNPVLVAAVELAGVRTALCVPMLKEGELVGGFTLSRQEVRPFSDKQIELVQNFAAQAVIAIENARLLTELRQRTDDLSRRSVDLTEALEQQTATSEVLQVISSSPGDLEPVFATMLENAVRICDASFGNIYRWDGQALHVVAAHKTPPAFADFRRRAPLSGNPDTLTGRMLATKAVVHIADLKAERQYVEGNAQAVTAVELGGVRTGLLVPMLKENELIGAITLFRQEVRAFTDKQIALVTNFAAQAVIAIENARLLNELRGSLEQQTATSKVLDVISRSAFDLQAVFETVVESSGRLCGADRAFLLRFDGELLRMAASHNATPEWSEWVTQHPIRPGRHSSSARAALERRTIHIPDVIADPEYTYGAGMRGIEPFRTLLAVPILRGNDLLGVLIVYHLEVRPFTDKQIALVETFADQAAIAIENTRLLDELRQRTNDLTESLEQQTATSEVLQVISTSPGDLEPVFSSMLQNAVRICDANWGTIFRSESGALRLVARHNTPTAFSEGVRDRSPVYRPHPQSLFGQLMATKAVVHTADSAAEEVYVKRLDRMYVAAVELGGARTALAVPMLKDDELIGAFAVIRREVRPFSDKQIALVENFAAQAVIAIENTRLLNELRQRTDELGRSVEELRALGEVSQAVNSTLDLETVLSTIVAKAVQLSGTEAGAIYVFDDAKREFHLRATYGMEQELIDALTQRRIDMGDPNVAAVMAAGEPIQVADLKEEVATDINEVTLRAGYRARLVAPLIRGEEVVGMLVVRRKTPGAFAQNTIDLMKTFAAQSVLAIQNARLFEDVEARTGELTRSLEDLRTAQDRLVQTQKLASLGQLTAGIAHEIKNPLNFVNNFSGVSAELLDELREALSGVKADDKTRAEITELADTLRDNLHKIVQHGRRADSIVKNMLLHSREGSGEHRPVDINAIVEEAVNLAYHGARAEKQGFNITLERSLDPAAGQVDCFPQEITRVLLNLISNGFYAATKRKGHAADDGFEPRLTAATKSLGDRVEIRIRDNGTGIPPEVRDRMFNPFFTTKPAGEGTGLGLSISHDIIVKQHAGIIEVDTKPGEFTEFRIVLQRAAAFPAR